MTRLFGTDGIRAPFGEYPLDRATVTGLGIELAELLGGPSSSPQVVLGGDTRFSTPEICDWLAAGLESRGAGVRFLGTVPTPAVAYLTRTSGAAAGIAVSASHNPWPDNGIKLIGADGFKWPDASERALEERLEDGGLEVTPRQLDPELEWQERYLQSLRDSVLRDSVPGDSPLDGLHLALDAANGAAAAFAAPLFEGLGARVTLLFATPDGRNINEGCGSTHPEALCSAVVERGCDLGVAFDGDADRALFVDERGELRDGDTTLFLWARDLRSRSALTPPRIVATSMSNLGLERALSGSEIEVVRCGVGDRKVVETMRREGLTLGGEQSGHIVHLGLSTTGDGLLTALQVAAILAREGRPFSELLADFRRFPQTLKNLRVASKPPFETLPRVTDTAERIERELGREGRLVLRYSGTEPLARVMIEGPDQREIERMADELLAAIADELTEVPA